MRKQIPANLQQSTPAGGGLNRMPLDYKISQEPIGDAAKWGELAHVDDATRVRILETGFGEIQLHIDYIRKQINYSKKMRKKNKTIQLSIDFDAP